MLKSVYSRKGTVSGRPLDDMQNARIKRSVRVKYTLLCWKSL